MPTIADVYGVLAVFEGGKPQYHSPFRTYNMHNIEPHFIWVNDGIGRSVDVMSVMWSLTDLSTRPRPLLRFDYDRDRRRRAFTGDPKPPSQGRVGDLDD
jgi:hypothetical protein